MGSRRRSSLTVVVLHHAKARARERFPDYKLARIVDEVHEALLDGRVSATKPDGLRGRDLPGGLYAWTPGGERVFGLVAGDQNLVVRTVMRVGEPRS